MKKFRNSSKVITGEWRCDDTEAMKSWMVEGGGWMPTLKCIDIQDHCR